jgi:pyruvate,orthophosphate dikinase
VATKEPELSGEFAELMELADTFAQLEVRANADTPKDAETARNFGATGIGLARTEHMFFAVDRIKVMREMILATTVKGRKQALKELLPMQRSDFEGLFRAMKGHPVTIRLLDPPLHEFVPHQLATQKELAEELHISLAAVKSKVAELEEFNPMLGHRGCRLGNTYPEITEMQARAILEAALNLKEKEGIETHPEIMIPLVGTVEEFVQQKDVIEKTAEEVFKRRKTKIPFSIGTMMETPRGTLVADAIAEQADFFSFGTNDLTQMTFGYSRDDAGKFLPIYLQKGILKADPFEVLDQEGVGLLVQLGIEKGRKAHPGLKVGICGEHGGEPSSIAFFHKTGMNYVSCSPFRVPIARVAAAQAALEDPR